MNNKKRKERLIYFEVILSRKFSTYTHTHRKKKSDDVRGFNLITERKLFTKNLLNLQLNYMILMNHLYLIHTYKFSLYLIIKYHLIYYYYSLLLYIDSYYV